MAFIHPSQKPQVRQARTVLLTPTPGFVSLPQTVVKRKDVDGDIIFFVHPPRIGFYKLLVYGIPRPSEKGKWRLPLIASFLIESKLSRCDGEPPKEVDVDAKKKIRLKPRAR